MASLAPWVVPDELTEASSYRLNGGSSGLFSTLFVFVCDSSCVQCHTLMGLCHNDSDSGTCAPLRLLVRVAHNSKLECNVVALCLDTMATIMVVDAR